MADSTCSCMSLGDGLLLLLVAMKLTGHLDISWWWIIGPGIAGVLIGICIGIGRHAR